MLTQITIRNVCDKDIPAIQAIYALQVTHGVSSWEELPPSLEQMTQRQKAITQDGYPYYCGCAWLCLCICISHTPCLSVHC